MTESISVDSEDISTPSKDEMNENALIVLLGITLFVTADLVIIFSACCSMTAAFLPLDFALFRVIAFLCATATYFYLGTAKQRDTLTCSVSSIGLVGCFQLLLPAMAAVSFVFGFDIPLVAAIVIWALWGASAAWVLCSWINIESPFDEAAVSKINWWMFILAAILTTVFMFLDQGVCLIAVACEIIVSVGLLMWGLSKKPPLSTSPDGDAESDGGFSWSLYKKSGSYNMVVTGILIGFGSGYLITGSALHDFPVGVVGLAVICSVGLFFLARAVFPPLLYLEYNQRLMLPFVVCCLALMAILRGTVIEVLAFVLFAMLYLVNLTNFFTVALRGSVLSLSGAYCFSLGRLYIVLGQAIGWLAVMLYYLFPDYNIRPEICVVLLVLVSGHNTLRAFESLKGEKADGDEAPQAEAVAVEAAPTPAEDDEADAAKHQPFKTRCNVASKHYGLTQREAEILFYLAKGRNAKYIADQLFVAERTVKTHAYHIYQKMEIHSQQELINIVDEF